MPSITETKPAGSTRPVAARSLRDWVARLQCKWLLLRYHQGRRMEEKGSAWLDRVCALPPIAFLGEFLYALGFQAEYSGIRFWRGLKALRVWLCKNSLYLAKVLQKRFKRLFRPLWDDILRPFYTFGRGVYNMFVYAGNVRREKGAAAAVWKAVGYFFRGVFRYAMLVPRLFAYIIPAAAIVMFVTVVQTVLHYNFTLAVQVNGETVGYVANESVFDTARETVNERINYAGTRETEWSIQPTYTLSLEPTVMNENQMADAILFASSDEISEGAALYMDGNLYGVTTDGDKLRGYLHNLTAPYEDPSDPNQRVTFNRQIELVDGVFFNDSITDCAKIEEKLEGLEQAEVTYTVVAGDSWSGIAQKNGLTKPTLLSYNPGKTERSPLFPGDVLVVGQEKKVLQVLIVRTETRQEEIPYATVEQKSSDYMWGVTKTITEGEKGLKEITEDITYDVDGNRLDVAILQEVVLREPVNKVVIKGTKLPSGATANYGSGSWMWPVPNYTYVSRWYGKNGHKGTDICAAQGAAILASDAGVVTAAGWNAAGSNYGYSIVINHGNGYTTVYAHCIAVYVSAGQSVSQGSLIGAVGSTGRSTGNHCHWEIRYNGVKIPPQNWFGTSSRPV